MKLYKLQLLLQPGVNGGQLSPRTLQRIAGVCMNMTVAIRPTSGRCTDDHMPYSRADLLGESRQWLGISWTSQERTVAMATAFPGGLEKRIVGCVLGGMGGAW